VGRITQGVKLIDLAEGDHINSVTRVVKDADEGELAAPEPEVEEE
jgi:hypothetical protein